MNRDYILGLSVGEELNNLVTHEIMGYENNWSESISAAWEVVEKITSKGYDLKLHCVPLVVNNMFDCTIYNDEVELAHVAMKSTAPEAICKAALLAVMEVSHDL
jgi:hypothetical protein